MASDEDGVTLGELHRRLGAVEGRMDAVQASLVEIKTTLATQGVKVGVVWAGLGVGASALVMAMVSLIISVIRSG
jgi:TRAP-type mannitol/chloroaromatic compound transport system permease large subunit